MNRSLAIFAVCVMTMTSTPIVARAEVNEAVMKRLTESGEDWLSLLDRGLSAQAWEETSSGFQERMAVDVFVEQMTAFRDTLGKRKSRTLSSTKVLVDGQEISFTFNSNFQKQDRPLLETVILKLENDIWRVASYSVQ